MRGRPMCVLCLIFSGALYFLLTIWPIPVYNDTTFEGSVITVIGEVVQKEYKNDSYLIYLKNAHPSDEADSKQKTENNGILVYCDDEINSFGELPAIGSIVRVEGKKRLFDSPANEGQFDSKRYYQIHGVDYKLMNGKVRAASRTCHRYQEALSRLRFSMGQIYIRILGEKDASVIQAMLLGDKTSLDQELKELYQRAGLGHALCISGLHISLIGLALYKLLRKLFIPLPFAGVTAGFLLISYGIMTGMGTATKRAVIMFLLCVLADLADRSYDLLSALALAGLLTLASNPLLLYDSGFLLSFGAVIGIGTVVPLVEWLFPWKGRIISAIKLSLGINLFTFPLTLLFFYQYPVYSIFLNLIMIPLMTWLLAAGILCGLSGSICSIGGAIFAFPCHLILAVYERGCSLCDKIPGSIFTGGKPDTVPILLYYTVLALSLLVPKYLARRKGMRIVVIICLMLVTGQLMLHPHAELEINMLDVGQGDCIVLRQKGGLVCLVDGGSSDVKQAGKYRIMPFLKSQGIGSVDYAFVSHTDADHISGILELMQSSHQGGIVIRHLVLPAVVDTSAEYQTLLLEAEKQNIPVYRMKKGDVLSQGELTLTCLYPEAELVAENKNACSMVLLMKYEDWYGLFTGDLEDTGEQAVTGLLEPRSYLFLKVAHHGSKNSTKEAFLTKVQAQVSLISCGKDNSYGHPHKELLERLERSDSRTFITKDKGEITVEIKGEEVDINCFKN